MLKEKEKSLIVVADWKPAEGDDVQVCAACGCEFRGLWGDEALCEECAREEGGTIRSWR